MKLSATQLGYIADQNKELASKSDLEPEVMIQKLN